jgi:hypothetical protein
VLQIDRDNLGMSPADKMVSGSRSHTSLIWTSPQRRDTENRSVLSKNSDPPDVITGTLLDRKGGFYEPRTSESGNIEDTR